VFVTERFAGSLKLYWSRSKPNFGDALSPLICEAVSGKQMIHAKPGHCQLVALGSLMHRFQKRRLWARKVHVWGTGFMAEPERCRLKHHFHAVRGHRTREALGLEEGTPVGDPGLLAHLLLKDSKPAEKRWRAGFMAHYKDKGNHELAAFVASDPRFCEIDVFAPPHEVLKQIHECDVVFSSAMHGLIAADALRVPNAWLKLSDLVRGNDFKFCDYYSVFGMDATPVRLTVENVPGTIDQVIGEYERCGLSEIQEGLIRSFPQIT